MRINGKILSLLSALVLIHCVSVASAASFNLSNLCDLRIYLSGASAQDGSLDAQVRTLMAAGNVPGKAGTPIPNGSIFSGAQDNSWRVIIGELDTGAITGGDGTSVPAGTVGCFFKRSEGGSAWGVQPVSQGNGSTGSGSRTAGTAVVSMTALDCDDVLGPDNRGTCQQTGDGNMANIVPDAGLSDVEPSQFIGVNTPDPQVTASKGFTDASGDPLIDPTLAAMSSNDVAALEIFQQSLFAFGTVVNPEFYTALQVCQGIYSDFAAAAADASSFDNLDMMPSLTKGQVFSLFTGRLQTLQGIPCSNGGNNLYDVCDADANCSAPNLTGPEVCVRADGSGTKAQFRIKYFGVGCLASGAIDFQDPSVPFTNNQITIVSGSSDMGRCVSGNLEDAQSTIAQRWKIGFQSTEKVEDMTAGATDDDGTSQGYYRFVKVDNQAPTLSNTWDGGWFDAVNATLQVRSGTVAQREYYADVVDGVPGAGQDVENILQTLIANFAVPTDVGTANATLLMPGSDTSSGGAWYGGSLVIDGAGCDVNSSGGFGPTTNPCSIVTHQDTSLNNCRSPNYSNQNLIYDPS